MLSRLWLGLCLVLVLLSSALTWQVQAWRYGRLFAQQAEAQAHEAQARAEEAARALLAEREDASNLNNACKAVKHDIFRSSPMPNRLKLACVTAWLLLTCGCQSWSNRAPTAPQCLPLQRQRRGSWPRTRPT